MSYTRPCNKCGERISLREMPHGQWVAFDVSTEETHVCGVQHEPDVAVKLKGKNKSRKKEDDDEEIILKRHGKNNSYENIQNESNFDKPFPQDSPLPSKKQRKQKETYDSVSGKHHCINKAIEEEKRIFIKYYSHWKDEHSSRELSPITKFKYRDKNYLQAYCHLDKAVRVFSTKSIEEVTLLDKKIFKPKKIPKPDIAKFLEKIKAPKEDNEEDVSHTPKVKKPKKEYNPTNLNTASKFQNFIWKAEDFIGGLFSLAIALGMVGLLVYIFYMAILS